MNHRHLALAWALLLAVGCGPQQPITPPKLPRLAADAPATQPAPLTVAQIYTSPTGVTTARLSNQLTVIVKPVHTTPVVCVRAVAQAGSIYEKPLVGAGMSHLLEHMLAQEAAHDNAAAQSLTEENDRVTAIGGQSNANTGNDATAFYISASSARTMECIDLIAEWMGHPGFTKADFEREHGVVQRELELGSDDPREQLNEVQERNVFGSHPAAVPVIGYKKPLADLTWEQVVDYHSRMYVPQNIVFCVVGDVEVAPVLDRLCRQFAGFDPGAQPDLSLPDVAPLAGVTRATVTNTEVKEAVEDISFITIPEMHEDLYALDTLSYILTEGKASRLEETVVRGLKLATSVTSASWTPAWGKGEFEISFNTAPNGADAAEKAILNELRSIIDKGVTEAELTRAKRQKAADHVASLQTVDSISSMLAGDYLSTGNPEFSADYTQRIQAVTAEQVQQVAKKYLTLNAMAITRMVPAATAATGPATSAPAAKATGPRLLTLPNGLRVVLQSTPTVGLVAVTLVTEGGVLLETEKTNGMGTLMTALSTKGAGALSATEIAAFFDQAGGGLSGSCGYNSFTWQATVLQDSLPKALDVFADVILRPTFSPKELDILRQPLLDAIDRIDEGLLDEAFHIARQGFYKDSPYRLSPAGRKDVVSAATAEQIAQYHKQNMLAGSSVLAVFGNFDEEAAAAKIQSLFAAMPAGTAKVDLPAAGAAPKDSMTVVKTHKQGAAIVMYAPGTKITDATDRLPLNVLQTILSGWELPSGWLFNELREKQLVYDVHAVNWTGLAPGSFYAYAACQPKNAPEVLAIMRKNLDRAAACLPTQAEIDRAVNTILTTELLDNQSMSTLSLVSATSELYGLGYDNIHKMAAEYHKVTPADVQRAARKYLGHGYYVLVATPMDDAFKNASK